MPIKATHLLNKEARSKKLLFFSNIFNFFVLLLLFNGAFSTSGQFQVRFELFCSKFDFRNAFKQNVFFKLRGFVIESVQDFFETLVHKLSGEGVQYSKCNPIKKKPTQTEKVVPNSVRYIEREGPDISRDAL